MFNIKNIVNVILKSKEEFKADLLELIGGDEEYGKQLAAVVSHMTCREGIEALNECVASVPPPGFSYPFRLKMLDYFVEPRGLPPSFLACALYAATVCAEKRGIPVSIEELVKALKEMEEEEL